MSKKRRKRLCPVCGEKITVDVRTLDGRLIGSCGDAFSRPKHKRKQDPKPETTS